MSLAEETCTACGIKYGIAWEYAGVLRILLPEWAQANL